MAAKFDDIKVKALIDTGSQATLLQKSIFNKLNVAKISPLDSILSGFGKCEVKPIGYFTCNIEIDDEFECAADVYVVEDGVMTNEAIIGLNVLMKGETSINESGVIIKNKCQKAD